MTPQKTMEISPAIIEQINETPEERKYWRTGLKLKAEFDHLYLPILVICNSERAAWIDRECRLRKYGDELEIVGFPYEVTRTESTIMAIEQGCTEVSVYDESLQEVERWSVA